MIKNLSKDVKISLIQAPLAAGSSDPNSTALDMAGYDGCLFIGLLGTVCRLG